LKAEEEWIQRTCSTIASFKPDVVITEKVNGFHRIDLPSERACLQFEQLA
jgi:DNA polymerase elongation subunit (family B)